jgi:hypothetical protein
MRQTGIVPLIGSRDIRLVERSSIRGSEDSLQTLDFPDYLFQVHSEQYSEPPCKNLPPEAGTDVTFRPWENEEFITNLGSTSIPKEPQITRKRGGMRHPQT